MGEMGGEKRRSWQQGGHMRGRPGPTFRPPRSHPKQQHVPSEAWQPSVPLWEKKFCTSVCLIPWEKICETQRVLPMYARVAKWDDSAGEEAFQKAKTRYWAEINGLPCDIPLPDPDAYIDVIDYDSVIDPLLVEDLYKLPPSVDSEEDLTCGWDSFLFADRPVPATGWGDEEDQVPAISNKTEHYLTVPSYDGYHENVPFYSGQETNNEGYGNFADRQNSVSNAVNIDYGNRQHDRAGKDNTCAGGKDDSSGNGWNNSWGYSEKRNNLPRRVDGKRRDGGGHFNSRHANSRYHARDNQGNNGWRASRGRGRTNNAYKQSTPNPERTDLVVWF
ncbi:hypothetical protein IHE45_12G044800 [Dioscorea alata]|uniref:Uncharacterized protein n=1 Tax=Dioscorea alata TaxID=55571 RepID=A0ACB7V1K7_DIOAL|nr:hypothetical protein IHE45_12G044800 [Dioscorea alata]